MTDPGTPAGQAPSTRPSAEPVCCGEGGAWAPAGQPLVPGCMLCPKSATTYWRTHRADDKPYRPVPPLGSPADE